MSKEDIIKCFLDCKDKGNGFQLTLTNKDIDIIANEIERLKEENNFLKLNNPQMNLEHFRVVKENKRKMDNLRQVNKRLNNIINKKEQFLGDNIKRLEREVVKRDNIINELEKDIKNLYTYGIKNNAEQRDYLLNKLGGLQELKGDNNVI